MLVADDASGTPQCERASVIAEALPLAEDVGRRGVRELFDGGKPRHEAFPSSSGAFRLRLLRDDFGHKDRVGIARSPEGERPTVYRVPVEDRVADIRDERRDMVHDGRIVAVKRSMTGR